MKNSFTKQFRIFEFDTFDVFKDSFGVGLKWAWTGKHSTFSKFCVFYGALHISSSRTTILNEHLLESHNIVIFIRVFFQIIFSCTLRQHVGEMCQNNMNCIFGFFEKNFVYQTCCSIAKIYKWPPLFETMQFRAASKASSPVPVS